jgi:shikimate dehydrogenase
LSAPKPLPTAATRLIVLLGDPVAHSLSPAMQNAAFRAAGVDGVYVALRCDAEHLPGLLRGIAAAGGAGNVTVPHKQRVAALVDTRTAAVERTGACNTFWAEDGRVCGDNTDVEGFRAAVRALVGAPAGRRGLRLGARGGPRPPGGAAPAPPRGPAPRPARGPGGGGGGC